MGGVNHALVAQLDEHQAPTLDDAGSSPAERTNHLLNKSPLRQTNSRRGQPINQKGRCIIPQAYVEVLCPILK